MRKIKCTTGEIVTSYKDYLSTDHWKIIKEKVRIKFNNKCNKCGSQYRLETHHKTYKNIGKEPMSDLILLCHNCHYKLHDALDRKLTAEEILEKETNKIISKLSKEKIEHKREFVFDYIIKNFGKPINKKIKTSYDLFRKRNTILKFKDDSEVINYIEVSGGYKVIKLYDENRTLIRKIKIKDIYEETTNG